MKRVISIVMLFYVQFSIYGQYNILYDLDSYLRVDIDFRTTFISPDARFGYDNVLNSPTSEKKYNISFSGTYNDFILKNSATLQASKTLNSGMNFRSGTQSAISTNLSFRSENRLYKDNKYVNYGFEVFSFMSYNEDSNTFRDFNKNLNAQFNFGFGFGRLEIINNAWIGARILEELNKSALLVKEPNPIEMKLFFDLIGDVDNERVMDFRLSDLYQIEKIIQFVEDQNWIEEGSIRAFSIIYDAFRYENFILRRSGRRLEFMMKPYIEGQYRWINTSFFNQDRYLRPGFEACVEYQSHRNGDLKYYTVNTAGARLNYNETIRKGDSRLNRLLEANMYYGYRYRYIPSLRTNLLLETNLSAGFIYLEESRFDPLVSLNVSFQYNYYFAPSTQLVLRSSVNYEDEDFQVGDFQPHINASFNVDVLHAIR